MVVNILFKQRQMPLVYNLEVFYEPSSNRSANRSTDAFIEAGLMRLKGGLIIFGTDSSRS